MAITSLGYVRIQMQDPSAWLDVGENVLGFRGATAEDGSVRLRMDSAPFRYLIERGDADRFVAAGWECAAADYDALRQRLTEAGVALSEGDVAACSARSVAAFVTGEDPSGNQFELFHSRVGDDGEFAPALDGVGYVADDLGLGHAVLPAPDHEATCTFYREVLGFGISDELTLPPPAEGLPEMRIHFFHADNPRHHSLALFNGPAPSGVVHLMTEMQTMDQVGACLDRVNARGLPITASLGRHENDRMVSFYFLAPAGIPMEVGYDGLQLDWSNFEPTQSTVGDVWGHEYNFPE